MNRAQGTHAERLAAAYLQNNGYTLIAHSSHQRFGEIDLITQKENKIVFCEVKSRRSLRFGSPLEAITYRKRCHLIKAIERYLFETKNLETPWRLDLIGVIMHKACPPQITHLKNILA